MLNADTLSILQMPLLCMHLHSMMELNSKLTNFYSYPTTYTTLIYKSQIGLLSFSDCIMKMDHLQCRPSNVLHWQQEAAFRLRNQSPRATQRLQFIVQTVHTVPLKYWPVTIVSHTPTCIMQFGLGNLIQSPIQFILSITPPAFISKHKTHHFQLPYPL